jgi:hypothetical protein
MAGSVHYRRAIDTVGVGVQSQRSEDVVATEGSTQHEIGFKVLAVAFLTGRQAGSVWISG